MKLALTSRSAPARPAIRCRPCRSCARHMLDPMRVDHPGGNARVLQVGVHALPVDARALHHHQFDVQLRQPGRQSPAVTPKPAELTRLTLHRAVGLLEQHRHHVQHAVHVDTGHAPVQGSQSKVFHLGAPVVKVPGGTQGDHLFGQVQDAIDRGLEDSSNRYRFGPLYRSCCNQGPGQTWPRRATVWGSSQPGGDLVRRRGRAFTRIATSIAQCAASHLAPTSGFHGRGRCARIMIG
jgi:hypothetical protein